MKRFWCCVSIILLFTPLGHGADKWLSARSRNFLLVGNASESQMRRVGRNLEEFRAAFASLFPWVREEQASVGTTVVVFKDDSSFRPYKPLYEGKPANVAGYFQAGPDVNFIALTAAAETPHVIYHELVHSFSKDATAMPLWAGEGLAEFYGVMEIASNGKELLLGRPMTDHVLTLSRTSPLPLETFFAVEHDSPHYNEKTKQGIFYAQSWAIIHYLMLGNEGQHRPHLARYLELLSRGNSIEESFRQAFQMEPAQLERELNAYLRGRLTWPAIKAKFENKIDYDREMKVSPLSDAQGQYYLGDLLLHTNRLEAAEAQLQKAIALDPNLPASFSSMGLLKVRQDKHEDALNFLEKAVQADSQNHMAHFYYAYMLQQLENRRDRSDRKSSFELMRLHLKKTIELAPRFIEAYSMLGYVALVLRSELAETEEALKKAIALAPGRHELRITLAEVMVFNDEPLAARVVLAPMKNLPGDSTARRQAETMLGDIAAGIANQDALREYEQRRRQAEAAKIREPSIDEKTAEEPPRVTRKETPASAADSLIETAKPQLNRPAGLLVEGFLTFMDCSQGLTLRVRVDNQTVELHTDKPSQIEFVSYVTAVSDSVACGPVKPEIPVAVVYGRTAGTRFLGEPIRVEFIDRK